MPRSAKTGKATGAKKSNDCRAGLWSRGVERGKRNVRASQIGGPGRSRIGLERGNSGEKRRRKETRYAPMWRKRVKLGKKSRWRKRERRGLYESPV